MRMGADLWIKGDSPKRLVMKKAEYPALLLMVVTVNSVLRCQFDLNAFTSF
jgi:hypothetical protein